MSTPALSGKLHGEKSSANSGKKHQAVNINSVYSGKSLVGQKNSGSGKHGGMQSLGKATAVARRMPPPANLPSLKSESAGQDPTVNIIPAGVAGWGNQQQQSNSSNTTTVQPPAHQQQTKAFFDSLAPNKKVASDDGISLRPSSGAGATVAVAGKSGAVSPPSSTATGTSATSTNAPSIPPTRPTWSTRIGNSSSGEFFASHTAQDYPKLATESESGTAKTGSGAPSLRPQKNPTWKSGGIGQMAKQQSGSISPSGLNGRERSRSVSPTISAAERTGHQQQRAGVYGGGGGYGYGHGHGHGQGHGQQSFHQTGQQQQQSMIQTQQHSSGLYHVSHRGGGTFPPSVPPQYASQNYQQTSYSTMPQSGGQMMMPRYGMSPQQHYDGRSDAAGALPQTGPLRETGGHSQAAQVPPAYRSGGAPMGSFLPRNGGGGGGGVRGQPEADYCAPRDCRGEQWTAYRQENHFSNEGVWSDDEAEERISQSYNWNDGNKHSKGDAHTWPDGYEQYVKRDWDKSYPADQNNQRRPVADGYAMNQSMQYSGVHGHVDNRYAQQPSRQMMPMQPMQSSYNYAQYDHRQMPGTHPSMHYPQTYTCPPLCGREPRDIEAEEEEEMVRQQRQEYERNAIIERSKQKRRLGQQPGASGAGYAELEGGAGDSRYYAPAGHPTPDHAGNDEYEELEQDRSSSRESYGNKSGNARQTIPPRFSRQTDSRQMVNQPYGYPQSQQYGVPGSTGYMRRAQGRPLPGEEGAEKLPFDQPMEEYYGDSGRIPDASLNVAGDTYEADVDANFVPSTARPDKPLKRRDSKESLSSRSDRSNSQVDKTYQTTTNRTRKWAADNITVKEEDDSQSKLDKQDNEDEDQKLETLTIAKVVKRSAPPLTADKTKDQAKTAETKQSDMAQKTAFASAAQKAEEVQEQAAADQRSKYEGNNAVNIWEQRKERLQNQSDRKHQRPRDKENFEDMSYDMNLQSMSREDLQQDSRPRRQRYDQEIQSDDRSGRGRGHGRREFVSSSHRLQSVPVGNNYRRGSRGGAFEQNRRGGSVRGSVDNCGNPMNAMSEEKMFDGDKREDSSHSETPEGYNSSMVSQTRGKTGDALLDQKEDQDAVGPDGRTNLRGDYSARGRSRGARASTRNTTSRGQAATFNRTRGYQYPSGGGYDDINYGYEEEETSDEAVGRRRREDRESNFRRNPGGSIGTAGAAASNANVRDSRAGVPPRFQEQSRGGGTSGSRTQHNTARGNQRRDAAATGKSSAMHRENQSEGNEEWETASESSDVGERVRSDSDQKRRSLGPKSFSNQRRTNDKRRVANAAPGQTVWGPNSSGGRRPGNGEKGDGTVKDGDPNILAAAKTNSAVTDPKNVKAASHQASSKVDGKLIMVGHNNHKKNTKKDERLVSKPDGLAAVDINNIAGVAIIDDQPDSAMENQDGFQEVSRKRLKKEVIGDEKEKSQSPSNHSRSQHSGNTTKKEKHGKKQQTAQSAGLSVTHTSSSSEPSESASQAATNPWERKATTVVSPSMFSSKISLSKDANFRNENLPAVPTANGTTQLNAAGMPSKTGVEIWGTPDPVPFSGANEQTGGSKCVARPSKITAAGRPKSVEFVADGLNKKDENAAGVKLDFTFDASLGSLRDDKENNVNHRSLPDNSESGLSNENSPSADQLSEKIASVKKVWDGMQDPNSQMRSQPGGSSFFSNVSDAETAAIVSSAASLVSAAVLHSVQPSHASGYDSETTKSGDTTTTNAASASLGSTSSKMEGPNVAKVRPQQQILAESNNVQSMSLINEQDEFVGATMNVGFAGVNASGNPSATYAFTAASHSLFSNQFPPNLKVDTGAASTFAPVFPSNGPVINGGATYQNAFVLPPSNALTTPGPIEMSFPTNSMRSTFAADQNLLYGTRTAFVSQPLRAPSTVFSSQPAKQPPPTASVFGNQQPTSYMFQERPASLFTQPPPALGAVGSQLQNALGGRQAVAPQQTPSQQMTAGGFYFTQPPPMASQQPPPMAATSVIPTIGVSGQTFSVQPAKLNANLASLPAQSMGSYGWNQKPALPVGGKVFNPIIAPPPSQKGGGHASHTTGVVGLVSPPPTGAFNSSVNTTAGGNAQLSLFGTGNLFKRGSGAKGSNNDQAKRDGDLLQQMDKFINSTCDEDAADDSDVMVGATMTDLK